MPLTCSYCGENAKPTTGKMLIKQSGEQLFFCSGKCETNFENNRDLDYADKEP